MAYTKNNLISRPGYSGMGDFWDSITGAAGSVLKFYGSQQQAVGAATATAQQNRDLTAALMAQQGGGTTTMLLLGGAGLALYLLMRKRT
jgi:hypothetical protein